ncbi:DoxX family protein [filamentous cyanobacterium LEGE 11480]|uniref:DoxX family protein n=1 Tax=Romeriopsis navalis LEGE 11480 TaxID=2777977 RepID=A0A928VIQ7_9CYAN|nr:DoxX family protein [Romeriopsis navalis]MBE9029353.1 DoxX family protein [Romeriopsis navalis LEGE 11480]
MTTTKSEGFSLATVFASNSTDNSLFQVLWLVVRVVAGVLMVHNGLAKLADVPGFAEHVVAVIGFPAPVFFTYCAAYAEIVGAICLALGLLTRVSALSLLGTMLVAIFFHLKVDGVKVAPLETATLYASFYLFFLVNGGGKYAVDALLAKTLGGES